MNNYICINGKGVEYNGKTYKIGDYIYAGCENLYGVITGIETENGKLNLKCFFNLPMWQEDIDKIIQCLPKWTGDAIMSPDEVEVITKLATDVRDKMTKAFTTSYGPISGDIVDIAADKVVAEVMAASAYKDEGHWNDDDIHLAMGSVFYDILRFIDDGRAY